MIILGIDPGYDRLGIAIIDKQPKLKEKLIYSTCLTSNKKDNFPNRLKTLGLDFKKILDSYNIDLVNIESVFIANNKKTAMKIGEVRGMLIFLCASNNIPVIEMTPLEIKMAITGFGNASKDQIMKMAKMLISIPPEVKLDDEFDAIVIALAGLSKNIHLLRS
ncbi:MAG TPA: crossover junction endodeoxyribonuclease RuvC [Candidatus Paceibacterota bacterium]